MKSFSSDELRAIARAQHLLIAAIGINLLITIGFFLVAGISGGGPGGQPPVQASNVAVLVLLILGLLLMVIQIFAVFRLARALGSRVALLWALGMLIPCLSLILLLVLNHRATRALRAAGIRVGLLGAGQAEVERALAQLQPPPAT